MSAKQYRLKIVRGDQQFEAEGDKKFVLDMLKCFNGVTISPPSDRKVHKPGKSEEQLPLPGKGISIGEFVRQLSIKQHTEFVLAFGYYLEKYASVKDFTPADINNCYYEAKMEPSNTSQMIIYNIRHGFMMESKQAKKGKKRYTLTRTGEERISSKLKK